MINTQQGGLGSLQMPSQTAPQQQLGSMAGAPAARLAAPKSPQQAAAEQIVESDVPKELEALLKERKAMELLASAQRDKQAQQPVQPQTIKSQVEGGISSLMQSLMPGMAQRGRQVQVAQNRRMMGMAGGGIVGMAEGGIVGYAKGDLVRASDIDMDNLLDALMIAESGGDPRAVSRAGAEGAYQIMPSTAAQPGFGVQPMEGSRFDPEASRKFARQYLQAMIDRYDGDIEAALIAYNAGAGNADKFVAADRDYDVLPQTMQTQPYVDKIMGQLKKEGRRRDVQLGGGRTISTTAPEGYTERMRRERADRVRGIETARMPPRPPVEAERYEPNIPDALTVAKAQQELRDPGSTSTKYTPEERESGGIGYLQYLARKQQEKKDEAARAARYMGMMQNQEDIISRANPATRLAGVDTRKDFSTERSMKSPAQRMEEAFPGAREAAGRYAMDKASGLAALSDRVSEPTRSNNPLVNLRSDIGELGSYLRNILGFQEGGEIKKYAGEDGSLVEGDSALGDALLAALQEQEAALQEQDLNRRDSREQPGAARRRRRESPATKSADTQRKPVDRIPFGSPEFAARQQRIGEAAKEDVSGILNALVNLPSTVTGSLYNLATQPNAATRLMQRGAEASGIAPFMRGLGVPELPTPDPAYGFFRGDRQPREAQPESQPAGPQGTLQQLAATGETGTALAGLFGEGVDRPARFRNVEEAREQAKDREGLMNRVGSALTSDRARAIANALSKLSYAGGATEGYMGQKLQAGLQAEKAAADKVRLQEEAIGADLARSEATLEAARLRAQQQENKETRELLAEYFARTGDYRQDLANDLGVDITDLTNEQLSANRERMAQKYLQNLNTLSSFTGAAGQSGVNVTPAMFAADEALGINNA